MELKDYVRIVRKRWWIVVATFAATTILTVVFVDAQPSVYESKATLVVQPSTSISDDAVRAIDILSRRVEITTTYANIAESRLIKDRAIERLELTEEERSGLAVSGGVVTGSNLLEIGVAGQDRETVGAFAAAVASETVEYIVGLDEAYELTILDDARIPTRPVAANKRFTVLLGAAFGLFLGVGLALLVEQLGWPVAAVPRPAKKPRPAGRFNIIDRDTSAYNEAYLLMRCDQELARSRRAGPVCLGSLKVQARDAETGSVRTPPRRDLREVVEAIQPTVRDEDLLAYVGSGSFVVMLPEVDPEYAESLLEQWAEDIADLTVDRRVRLEATVGTGAFGSDVGSITAVRREDPLAIEEVEDDQAGEARASGVMLEILSPGSHG